MGTVFQKYPQEKRAFINPEDYTKQNSNIPELCVSTFSKGIIDKFASLDNVKVKFSVQGVQTRLKRNDRFEISDRVVN